MAQNRKAGGKKEGSGRVPPARHSQAIGSGKVSQENFVAKIFYKFRCHLNQQESYNRLRLAFHDESPSLATIYKWLDEFKRGSTDLTDNMCEGCYSVGTTEDNISAVRLMTKTDKKNDRPADSGKLKHIGISQVYKILYEHLAARKLRTR
ncbi:hypothetical protein EVAR_16046_1 [Eumeta japonica]|uniref:Mos1 transposase HTH domain-containing protein n=1 Tax=Eumeta variegata TaxID=151549 RepID=A0A4C1VYS4_EUMVA|nr:hypothetical protein EVAR_16046_1 [Eumeta japonica]